MAQVQALFGDVYKIQMREHQLIDNLDWLNETVARLFVHARVYQCPRFHGPDVIKHSHLRDSWSCPGGCGLRKAKHKLKKSKLISRPIVFFGFEMNLFQTDNKCVLKQGPTMLVMITSWFLLLT